MTMDSPTGKSYSVKAACGGKQGMALEEVVSKHQTKHYQSAQSTAVSGRRAAPFPERPVVPQVDTTFADPTDNNAGDELLTSIHNKREVTEERRDPPASWEPEPSNDSKVEEKAVFPFIRSEDTTPCDNDYKKKLLSEDRDLATQDESMRPPTVSHTRSRNHPPTYRHPHHLLPILTPPTAQATSSRFPFIPNEDRHPPMSPANSFTVNTEREGKKVMSQSEMSEFIRSSIVKARQQAAAQPQGKQIPRTTLVEFLPPNLRTNFRTALRQQPIGKPQGPFPWSPILAHAAAAQTQFEDLEMRSIAEWTEPSQLTEPSALMTMSEQIRHLGFPGVNDYIVLDQTELYEEVDQLETARKEEGDSIGAKTGDSAGPVKGSTDVAKGNGIPTSIGMDSSPFGSDIPTIIDMASSPYDGGVRDNSSERELKSGFTPQVTSADVCSTENANFEETGVLPDQDDSYNETVVKPEDTHEEAVLAVSDASTEVELPDAIESLRHRISPRSASGLNRTNMSRPSKLEQHIQNKDDNSEVCATGIDEASAPKQMPSTIDIMNDQEIDNIVLVSMDKAQKTAKMEVQTLLQDSKRSKNNLVVKTSDGDKILSQVEVADLINESMVRARESAQQEIAAIVKDSLRLARESAKEEIRVIVEESMRRARESTQREMQEFVKESFQKTRWSDASAVSMGSCSQAYTAADTTLNSSVQPRQSPFGSQMPSYATPGQSAYHFEHLKALSEEDQNNGQEMSELAAEGEPAKESFETKIASPVRNIPSFVDESLEAPGLPEKEKSPTNQQASNQVESVHLAVVENHLIEDILRTPKHDVEDGGAGDSLMVLKTCTSPDVFAGIEDHEVQDPMSPQPKAMKLFSSPRQRAKIDADEIPPEEEGIEIDPPSGGFLFNNELKEGSERTVREESDGSKDARTDPSGAKGNNRVGRRDRYSRGQDPSVVSTDVVEKVREAGASISENLRDFDEQKQKRIENAALAILAESEKEYRRKDRRRSSSVARIETYIDSSSIENREHGKTEASRTGGRSRRHQSERREPPVSGRRTRTSRKTEKEPSEKASKKSSSRSHRSSTSSSRSKSSKSKSSKSISCGAESVVTQEFLASLTPKTREIKHMMTPRARNLSQPITHPTGEDTQLQTGENAGNGSLHRRCASKDSVSVPDNKFCLQFLQFLVTGGVTDDTSVTEQSAVIAATASPTPALANPIASGDTGGVPISAGAAGPQSNGLSAVLSPAAMFNKGSNWIDSLAEDMSSVLEGHDSTEFETEGETTTFDDRDDESSSSFSHTDGEVEEEENFAYDDNSYNAGWWSRGQQQPKHHGNKKPLPRRLPRRERRDDEEDSLLDGA